MATIRDERIGMILGPLQTVTARQRLKGGRKALEERSLFNPSRVQCGPFTFQSGFRIMRPFFREEKKVDAVFL